MSLLSDIKNYFKNTPQETLEYDWKEIRYFNHIGPDVKDYEKRIKTRRKFNKAVEDLQKTVKNFQVKKVFSAPSSNGTTYLTLQYKALKFDLTYYGHNEGCCAYTDDNIKHFDPTDRSSRNTLYYAYLGELLNNQKTLKRIVAAMRECAEAAVLEGDALVVEMRFKKKQKQEGNRL